MSEYTKGKWEIYADTIRVSCRVFRSVRRREVDFADVAIIPSRHGMSEQEALANARLIAAAPEMYELMHRLVRRSPNTTEEVSDTLKGMKILLARIDGKETGNE